jgi:hypothetical protein
MADISTNLTFVRWLRAKAEPFMDLSDDFLFSILIGRGINDDEYLYSAATEKQKDLCYADVLFAAAVSSVKTGTQGESDGGWTHYIAIKNAVNRNGLLDMAKALYDKWNEPFSDPRNKIRLKPLY